MTKYTFSLLPKGLLIGALMLAGCCCHDDDNDTDPVPVDPYNGHEYVDLGLPSGLKWATCNVGASKPEEYGDYFAWGDTVPYYSSQDPLTWKEGKSAGYDWSTYKWCKGSYKTLTKYCCESNFDICADSLKYIPFSGKQPVETDAIVKTVSGVQVPLFEARMPWKALLKGMDNQLRINLDAEAKDQNKYEGLQVGSVSMPNNNAGNWE